MYLQLQTVTLYEYKDIVVPCDRKHFYKDLDEHLSFETSSRGLRQWINTWEPVVLKSVKDALALGTSGMSAMTEFFKTKTQQTTTTTTTEHRTKEKEK